MGVEDAGAAALGHAVELGQAAGPALQHPALQLGREGRAGAELHLEGAEVEVVEARECEQPLVLHRHQHGVRDPVRLRQRQIGCRIEFAHQDHGAAKGQAREEHDQGGVRVQRRGQQGQLAWAVAVSGAALHMHPAHAVGLDDALGPARGARGIDDVEGRLGPQRDRLRPGAGRCQPGLESLARRRGIEGDAADLPIRRQQGRRRRVEEQGLRLGIRQHGGEVGRCDRGRQRRHHHAGAQGAEEHRRLPGRGQAAQRDRRAGRQAVALQAGRHAIDQARPARRS